MSDIRILLLAGDSLVRGALARALAGCENCDIVAQAAGETELLAGLDLHQPDVVLWDLGWQSQGRTHPVLEFMAEWAEEIPQVVVLAPEDGAVPELAVAAWAVGVRGVLSRNAPIEQLSAALMAVVSGLGVLDPELSPTIGLPEAGDQAPTELLTRREMEVLQLLAEGLPNKSVARELDISEHTVKFHVNAIMGKLSAQSRTEAVVQATRLGLIRL